MWFRRLFRRRRPPPPVLLPSLDRLAELIERVVELLDEVALGPAREPTPETTSEPNAVASPAPNPGRAVRGHVVLASSPDGYRLFERDGPPPARGDLIEIEGETLTVLRFGPSPLPGDWRRCAYLGKEPPKVDRTFER
jgi:hypothetical protein